ncbi:MAG: hypothetical protein CR982_03405 [Candidatus Cloacimonadota bacterium]|nr:MAG: hypothetical protein CR982_03405 [Candidatus Cloacimonadota bacterium]PIE78830.1 MAG: hypothetical protein CSA15_05860 [Candidatus Delongbacteria bacterium]
MKTILLLLVINVILFSAPPKSYKRGYELYGQKKYDQSIEMFSKLLEKYPESFYAGNAYYWIGMIDFERENYNSSILNFEKVLTCKNKWKFADALLGIAHCYERKNDKDKADIHYKEIYSLYKKSKKLVGENVLKIVKSKLGIQ